MSIAVQVISWLSLAAIFIVIEIISLGLTTIWFAGGAFVAAIACLCNANLVVQVILFLVVSILLLILTRPLAVKHLDSKTEKTNAESLIGQTAVVLQEINNIEGTGQAKVNGMEWTARAQSDEEIIPAGVQVVIKEIQGVKLIVERKEESADRTDLEN
ncbi:MAG: NfeD family protein [Lachnospiraceae bacterium]|nr:NfeD family protein [Lachnospiraceae bacterium]MDE6627435.1 NfeD family protein [Lachnospiraceae bacterium]